ncbi:MAG TPA: spore cortex biosynthesis protein YabQ [Bacillales bacterium]|nr:spore cortex biosynthesis protein YabQ [Bacillales bacterium]
MNLSVQFLTMAAMVGMGLWIGVSVDTYGRFFYRSGRRRWHPVQMAGDVLFWLLQGMLVFYVLLHVNHGNVRIYIFLALLCGYAAYKGLFESLYMQFLNGLIRVVRGFIRILKKIGWLLFVRPVHLLWQFVYTLVKWLLRGVLAALFVGWTVVSTPVIWVGRLVVPDAALQGAKNFFGNLAGVFQQMKKVTRTIIQWFTKSD